MSTRRSAVRWWLIAPTLVLFVIVNQLDKTNISVLIADHQFLSDFHLLGQPARMGFLSSVFFYAYGVSLMLWGFVVDRIGPQRSAVLGVIGWGWVNGTQIGVAIGLPLVTALLFSGGWRMVFWAYSAGSVAILLPMLLLLAPDEPSRSRYVSPAEQSFIATHRAGARRSSVTASFSRVLRDERFWLITLCHACLVATFFGLVTWIPSYLTQVRAMRFSTMSAGVALTYLLPISLALLIGYVSDRTMRRATVAAAASVALALMVLGAVVVPSGIVSMLLLVISFAAPITFGATNTALLHVLTPPEQVGRGTGICVGVANVLGAGAPTVIGYLVGVFGGKYLAAFAFISALNLAQALVYLRVARLSRPRRTAS